MTDGPTRPPPSAWPAGRSREELLEDIIQRVYRLGIWLITLLFVQLVVNAALQIVDRPPSAERHASSDSSPNEKTPRTPGLSRSTSPPGPPDSETVPQAACPDTNAVVWPVLVQALQTVARDNPKLVVPSDLPGKVLDHLAALGAIATEDVAKEKNKLTDLVQHAGKTGIDAIAEIGKDFAKSKFEKPEKGAPSGTSNNLTVFCASQRPLGGPVPRPSSTGVAVPCTCASATAMTTQ